MVRSSKLFMLIAAGAIATAMASGAAIASDAHVRAGPSYSVSHFNIMDASGNFLLAAMPLQLSKYQRFETCHQPAPRVEKIKAHADRVAYRNYQLQCANSLPLPPRRPSPS